ncbi:cupin domain-containing protein [Pseudonocardia nigra]|uniref:cupin domain-containing protein n=1 Tax=Pseudonocardia nigra TaxID=1921578 RepID=UPI001C5EA9FF|nr:cupin domain-containing protein [Pseudonocardia nigra]
MTGFPGGTGVSHLRVYDWPAADGLAGGSPHLHTASAEGYVVLRGAGVLETLSSAGFRETPLSAGTLLWFTPGTVHRLVNTSGDLELVVVMQNAGLPEAGDAVLTYPPDVLADPRAYRTATELSSAAGPTDPTAADVVLGTAARRRRDLAVEGYLALRERVGSEGPAALAELHAAAVALVGGKAAGWRHAWERGPKAQADATGQHLDDIAAGRGRHLADASVHVATPAPGPQGHGMCGRLQVWDLDGAHTVA